MKNYKLNAALIFSIFSLTLITPSCTKEDLNDIKNDLVDNLESNYYTLNITYLDRALDGYEHSMTILGRVDRYEENPYKYLFTEEGTKATIPVDFKVTKPSYKLISDRFLSGMRASFKYKKYTLENRSFGIKIEVLRDGKLYKTYYLNNNPKGGFTNYESEGIVEFAIY
ncbi:MAG: hypothetical protein EOP00_15980 [Pedobacter sp.]|nr:MAG: hypothetical protein EOP00_15980 [Pedobacter sp.]